MERNLGQSSICQIFVDVKKCVVMLVEKNGENITGTVEMVGFYNNIFDLLLF